MFSMDATDYDTEDAAVALAKQARDTAFYAQLYAGKTPEEIWADQQPIGWRTVRS